MKTTADKNPWEIIRKKRGGVAGVEPPQRGVARNNVRARGEASPLKYADVFSMAKAV
jgi:hypothetical protein